MSLEEALAANTAALKELTAALLAAGALQTAQASATAHSSPAVQAVVKAQKEAGAKKSQPSATPTDATDASTDAKASSASKPSGEPSASTPTSSSQEPPRELQPWHEKTAALFSELDGGEPTFDNLRKAILGINQQIGRAQAEAVLHCFGADAITPKADKVGLKEEQYAGVFTMCLDVLAGHVDATASTASE